MNKSDVIVALSQKENLAEKQATDIVNLIFKRFTETLKTDGRVEIREFGSFTIRNYDSYPGRNPRTGAKMEVKEKKLPFFPVGKELKNRVNS